jgi:hypothetical protein
MSDEKRQTRLLPFRRGRAAARHAGTGAGGGEDFGADAELTALLREWEAPPQSAGARVRLLAEFRATARPAPLWRRALAAHVRVPLPVAACAALALLLSPLALGARPWSRAAAPAAAASATPDATAVRVVEVPVVRERVVERIVYVEKKERGVGRGVSSQAAARELPAAGTSAAARVEARRQEAQAPSPPDASAGYFTPVDMEDFQPADEVKIRMLKRGGAGEK